MRNSERESKEELEKEFEEELKEELEEELEEGSKRLQRTGSCSCTCLSLASSWREATMLRNWKKPAATWRPCRCRSS